MNRSFITLVFVCCFFSVGFAQVHLSGENNLYFGSSAITTEEVNAEWDVVNATDQTLEFCYRRYALQEVPGADGNFCWGFLCIAWSTGHYNASSEVVTMAPGETNHSFKAKYRHHGNEGQSIYRYCLYEVNDLVDDVCQTVNFCVDAACVVSTEEVNNLGGDIQISPNPIQNIGNITYRFNSAPTNGKLVVYNTVGAKVKEIRLNNREGVVFLGASDFQSGIYFCSIEDNGNAQSTVKMIIQ